MQGVVRKSCLFHLVCVKLVVLPFPTRGTKGNNHWNANSYEKPVTLINHLMTTARDKAKPPFPQWIATNYNYDEARLYTMTDPNNWVIFQSEFGNCSLRTSHLWELRPHFPTSVEQRLASLWAYPKVFCSPVHEKEAAFQSLYYSLSVVQPLWDHFARKSARRARFWWPEGEELHFHVSNFRCFPSSFSVFTHEFSQKNLLKEMSSFYRAKEVTRGERRAWITHILCTKNGKPCGVPVNLPRETKQTAPREAERIWVIDINFPQVNGMNKISIWRKR